MGELRSYQFNGGGRKLKIINGKAYNVTQVNMTQPRSSDPPTIQPHPLKVRKTIFSSSSSSIKAFWSDPEIKRKKRVAKYKYYGVEGRVKASLKKGFRWFKGKCSQIVHGF